MSIPRRRIERVRFSCAGQELNLRGELEVTEDERGVTIGQTRLAEVHQLGLPPRRKSWLLRLLGRLFPVLR